MKEEIIEGTNWRSEFSIDNRLGYTIETLNDDILAITFPGDRRTFQVGQNVVASGRIFVRRGTEGTIVKIDNPFESRFRSSDIIYVLFKGFDHPHMMKPKDLI